MSLSLSCRHLTSNAETVLPNHREVLMTVKVMPTEVLSPKQGLKEARQGQGVCVLCIFILSAQVLTFPTCFIYTDPEYPPPEAEHSRDLGKVPVPPRSTSRPGCLARN